MKNTESQAEVIALPKKSALQDYLRYKDYVTDNTKVQVNVWEEHHDIVQSITDFSIEDVDPIIDRSAFIRGR